MRAGERVVVIGGDAAGMSAASQAKRQRPDLRIVAFERGRHTSFSACGMPYFVAGLVQEASRLVARTPEGFAQQGIDARILHEVEGIDLAARRVAVRDLESNRTFWEPFDHLVIGTGARPIPSSMPGVDARNIFTLSVLQDGIQVQAAIQAVKPRRVVIVGGGYIGVEMAEAMVHRGIPVAVVQSGPEVLGLIDPPLGRIVSRAMRDAGVQLFCGERATGFEVDNAGSVTGVVTTIRTHPADLVVMGIGVRPNSALARAAGIPLGATGAIRIDDHMRTGVEGVWAAGDCAETYHLVRKQHVHVALGTVANKQGRICGINLGGGDARFPGVVGTAITKFCDLEVGRTGLNEDEARTMGLPYVAATIESTSRAGYYPNAGQVTCRVLAERGTGRLLGAQIAGTDGAAKRIDTFAAALHAEMTVQEFQYLDLAYAPPFASVWDFPLIAARKAAEML